MNHKHIILASIVACVTGMLLYSIQKNWIIFQFPLYSMTHLQSTSTSKKNITLHWFSQDTWQQDTVSVVWQQDQINCQRVLNAWLDNAVQEEIIIYDVHAESVALTSAHEAIISFDGQLFSAQASMYEKLMIISGITRTIKEALPAIQSCRFLLHQELYLDPHLDFSVSWSCT